MSSFIWVVISKLTSGWLSEWENVSSKRENVSSKRENVSSKRENVSSKKNMGIKGIRIYMNQIDRDKSNNSNKYSHKKDKASELGVIERVLLLKQLS